MIEGKTILGAQLEGSRNELLRIWLVVGQNRPFVRKSPIVVVEIKAVWVFTRVPAV